MSDVLAVEARASLTYWKKWRGFEISFKGTDVPSSWRTFATRNNSFLLKSGRRAQVFMSRNAIHPLNAIMNYAYAVVLAQVTRAIVGLGLDPCYGFLHVDKPGRVSFAYDILELLRVRVDKVVFGYARARRFDRSDFPEVEGGVVRLSARMAREIAALMLRDISFHECERAVRSVGKRL